MTYWIGVSFQKEGSGHVETRFGIKQQNETDKILEWAYMDWFFYTLFVLFRQPWNHASLLGNTYSDTYE